MTLIGKTPVRCVHEAYTLLDNSTLVTKLLDFAIHDEPCTYRSCLGNHQLRDSRKIKITIVVEDSD